MRLIPRAGNSDVSARKGFLLLQTIAWGIRRAGILIVVCCIVSWYENMRANILETFVFVILADYITLGKSNCYSSLLQLIPGRHRSKFIDKKVDERPDPSTQVSSVRVNRQNIRGIVGVFC